MTRQRSTLAALAAAAALAAGGLLPVTAAAGSYWHPANNESGVTVHPEHFQGTKMREQVRAEAIEAQRSGAMVHISERGEPAAAPTSAARGLTRQQVVDDLLSETPEDRRARQRAFRG